MGIVQEENLALRAFREDKLIIQDLESTSHDYRRACVGIVKQ